MKYGQGIGGATFMNQITEPFGYNAEPLPCRILGNWGI